MLSMDGQLQGPSRLPFLGVIMAVKDFSQKAFQLCAYVCAVKSGLTYGNPFQGILGTEYLEIVYDSLLPGGRAT